MSAQSTNGNIPHEDATDPAQSELTRQPEAGVHIDVISDVICPWCYIGKRRLDLALAPQADDGPLPEPISVTYRPFLLDPTLPREGMERRAYMRKKFGETEEAREQVRVTYETLLRLGTEVGISFAFERIERTPNTVDAHRLLRWAHSAGVQAEIKERLMSLYFCEGVDVSDRTVLTAVARDAGMDGDLVADLLDKNADIETIWRDAGTAQRMGIQGVPAYIFSGKAALLGAQDPGTIRAAIRQVAV